MTQNRRMGSRSRGAFTLIELLVVIAIIAILAALAAWGVFAMIGGRQQRNTEANIRVINKLMQDRWAAVIADARKEKPSDYVTAMAGKDPERARVIWIKVRLMEAFPVNYYEVLNPSVLATLMGSDQKFKPHFARYKTELTGKAKTPWNNTTNYAPGNTVSYQGSPYVCIEANANTVPTNTAYWLPYYTESSACLLMALKTLGADGMLAVQDQLNPAINDTDGDGIPEFVDGWAVSLAFYRFPWNNSDLQNANPAVAGSRNAKYADPIDTGGTLINNAWYGTNGRTAFESAFRHPVRTGAGNAYYVAPVIVSAGKDGASAGTDGAIILSPPPPPPLPKKGSPLDLDFNLQVVGTHAADNIYSFQLKGD